MYPILYLSVMGFKAELSLSSKEIVFRGPLQLALREMKNYSNKEIITGYQIKNKLNTQP